MFIFLRDHFNFKKQKARLRLVATAVSLLLVSGVAQALGLGDIEMLSDLNQPVNAQIRLALSRPGEADGMSVSLASAQAFQRAGIGRGETVTDLRFSVELDTSVPIIKITGSQALVDPILTFLIDVQWSSGRMIREYTVLLDPAAVTPRAADSIVNADTEPAAASQNSTASSADAESVGSTPEPRNTEIRIDGDAANVNNANNATSANEPNNAPLESPATNESAATVRREITVEPGDTLSIIADENAIPGVSTQQMMMALLNANKDAFIDGNVNLVKVGAILRIPDRSDLVQLTQAQAVGQLDEQNQLWREYRDKIRSEAGTKVAAAPEQPQPQLSESAQRILESAQGEVRRELNIVAQTDTASTGASATADKAQSSEAAQLGDVNNRFQLANEELASNRLEKIDLTSQSEELSSTIENMQALINVRQNEIARLQEELTRTPVEQVAIDNDALVGEALAIAESDANVQLTENESLANVELQAGSASEALVLEPALEPLTQHTPWYFKVTQKYGDWILAIIGLLSAYFIASLLLKLGSRRRSFDESFEQNNYDYQHSKDETAYAPAAGGAAIGASVASKAVVKDVSVFASHVNHEYSSALDVNLDVMGETATYEGIGHDSLVPEVDAYLEDGLYDIAGEMLGEEALQDKNQETYLLKSPQTRQVQVNSAAYAEASYAEAVPNYQSSEYVYQDSFTPQSTELTFDEDIDHTDAVIDASAFTLNERAPDTDYYKTTENQLVDDFQSDFYQSDEASTAEYIVNDDAHTEKNEVWVGEKSSENLTNESAEIVEPTLQYKFISALFLGWCMLSWMPEVTYLNSFNLGLAPLCMLLIIVGSWGVKKYGSIDPAAYRVRFLVCACSALMIVWAYIGQFGLTDSILTNRLLLSLVQGLVILFVMTTVLSSDTIKQCIRVCGHMAVFSVLLCVVAKYNINLEETVFHGTNRASALFEHADQFGIILAMGIPVAALLVLSGRNSIRNVALLIILIWGLGLSGSKTDIVVTVATLSLVALYAIAISRHRMVLSLVVAGFAVYTFMSGFSMLEMINYRVASILQDFVTYGGASADAVSQRTSLWEHSLSVIANSPFFGEGPDHKFIANGELTSHSHNVILDYGRSVGVLGAIGIFVVLLVSLLLSIRTIFLVISNSITTSTIILAGGCFAIISYILSNQLSDSFNPVSSFFFWLALGLVLRRSEVVDISDIPQKPVSSDSRSFSIFSAPINAILEFKQTLHHTLRKSS